MHFKLTEIDDIKMEPENLRPRSRGSESGFHELAARDRGSPSTSQGHDENGDDDCMIVNESSCSTEAQKMWRENKRKRHVPIIIDDNEPVVKKEHDVSPEVPDIFEIQRKIMHQFNARRGTASAGLGAHISGESPSPALRHRKRGHRKTKVEDGIDMKPDLDTLMRPNDEDDSWMHDNFEETDELENIKRLKITLEERKRRDGKLSEIDTIELLRLERQIALATRRRRVAYRDQSPHDFEEPITLSDDEDNMTIEDSGSERSDYHLSQMAREIQANYLKPTGEQQKPSKMGGRGTRRKAAKTAREVEEMRREKAREKERKKRARSASPPKGSANKKRSLIINQKKGGKASKNKKHKSRMQASLEDGTDEALEALIADLKHNNIIADRQAQEDLGDAPVIDEVSKDRQMKALLGKFIAKKNR
jgi:hypothetical protein